MAGNYVYIKTHLYVHMKLVYYCYLTFYVISWLNDIHVQNAFVMAKGSVRVANVHMYTRYTPSNTPDLHQAIGYRHTGWAHHHSCLSYSFLSSEAMAYMAVSRPTLSTRMLQYKEVGIAMVALITWLTPKHNIYTYPNRIHLKMRFNSRLLDRGTSYLCKLSLSTSSSQLMCC